MKYNSVVVIDIIGSWGNINKSFYKLLKKNFKNINLIDIDILNGKEINNITIDFCKNEKINLISKKEDFENSNFDLLMCHNYGFSKDNLEYIVKFSKNTNSIFWLHTDYYNSKGHYKFEYGLDKYAFKNFNHIFAVSKKVFKLDEKIIGDKSKIHYIDNMFYNFTKPADKKINRKNIISSFTHSAFRKGTFETAKAIKLMNDNEKYIFNLYIQNENIRLFHLRQAINLFLDTNAKTTDILKYIVDYLTYPRKRKNIKLLSQIDNNAVKEQILKSKAVIVNSYFDASSVVVREAITLGCPVFASSVAGIDHELEKYLVIHNNKKELTKNLEFYLGNKNNYMKLLKLVEGYDYDNNYKQWEKRFNDAIKIVMK